MAENQEWDRFESIGYKSKYEVFKYLLAIRSYREAFWCLLFWKQHPKV